MLIDCKIFLISLLITIMIKYITEPNIKNILIKKINYNIYE